MELFNKEITSLSYKEIKAHLEGINILEAIKKDDFIILIQTLKNDSRKNVSSLGSKLEKDKGKLEKEILRVRNMYEFDKSFGEYRYIAGVDEVGRGPLAGPIVACAVILDENVIDDELVLGLNDSKKLSEAKRETLAIIIKEKAVAYKIALSSNIEIDDKGIAYSNNKVFLDSCNNLEVTPDLVLSDGYLVKNIKLINKSVIKGDTKSACIAAASIVAKVYRDNLMKEYAKKYPGYNFEDNAGYGTIKHIEGLKEFGPCEIHRKSFLTKIL
ncbi:ribonuclease HII [Clostridium sp. SHJSY1]|uniref:ribonuclease HII n=1 Tax=Clostridium sp. SHJSY1 TaxID=2942483 RepID=UPI002876FED9|nr:ribonuclease HII [Clostridium sp. SHJSY1]MDS0524907.1 ribonuclease HII [Clostridium sp. SHJSY1]